MSAEENYGYGVSVKILVVNAKLIYYIDFFLIWRKYNNKGLICIIYYVKPSHKFAKLVERSLYKLLDSYMLLRVESGYRVLTIVSYI